MDQSIKWTLYACRCTSGYIPNGQSYGKNTRAHGSCLLTQWRSDDQTTTYVRYPHVNLFSCQLSVSVLPSILFVVLDLQRPGHLRGTCSLMYAACPRTAVIFDRDNIERPKGLDNACERAAGSYSPKVAEPCDEMNCTLVMIVSRECVIIH
jgi:hypothetical protein